MANSAVSGEIGEMEFLSVNTRPAIVQTQSILPDLGEQEVLVKVQLRDDLVTWHQADEILIGADANGGDADLVPLTIPRGSAIKKFARLVVQQ